MPTFRVKNLSVSIGEQQLQQLCPFPTPYCLYPTQQPCHFPSKLCLWPTPCHYQTPIACLTPSCIGYTNPCQFFTNDCPVISQDTCGPAWSTLPPTTIIQTTPEIIKAVGDPATLETLRGQLEEALSVAKERGVQIEESMRPQTLKDVEALETELKAALEELRNMKKKMS